jgi:hypothetical protein
VVAPVISEAIGGGRTESGYNISLCSSADAVPTARVVSKFDVDMSTGNQSKAPTSKVQGHQTQPREILQNFAPHHKPVMQYTTVHASKKSHNTFPKVMHYFQ